MIATPDHSCAQIQATDVVERYVAGTLPPREVEHFEAHLITCVRCQDAVRAGVALRRALQTNRRVRYWSGRWATLAGLAAAAAIVLAVGGIVAHRGSANALKDLGRLEQPPVYLGVPVRTGDQPAQSAFTRAMSDYAVGRYREAAAGLRAAADSGAPVPPTMFFYGASLLMLDQPAQARDAFARVIAAGDNPYANEAHYYRALALLRLGDAASALTELRAIAGGDVEPSPTARALISKVIGREQRSR